MFDTPCANKETIEERLDRSKFIRYAVQFWGVHADGEAEQDLKIRKAIENVFGPEKKRKTILQIENYVKSTWGNSETPTRTRLIQVLAVNGVTTICKRFLNESKMICGTLVRSLILRLT